MMNDPVVSINRKTLTLHTDDKKKNKSHTNSLLFGFELRQLRVRVCVCEWF